MKKIVLTNEKWNELLGNDQFSVLRDHASEIEFSGVFYENFLKGVYSCVGCQSPLFASSSKGKGDGWPAFDICVPDGVGLRSDGKRIEIVCNKCEGHLGHHFLVTTHNYFCVTSGIKAKLSDEEPRGYCGILPYAFHGGVLRFLLGREATKKNWPPSNKWCDFGGKPEYICVNESKVRESHLQTATRECWQELMGILGCVSSLESQVEKKGSKVDIKETNSVTYLLPIDYDPQLPIYFNRIYNYLIRCTRVHPELEGVIYIPTCPEGYIEKTEMKWITYDEIISQIESTEVYRLSFLKTFKKMIELNIFPTLKS
ncbi:MAG: peptide-methionine (R)-S-oxide reductase [Hyperionvirus sp.]|uniref:Peptide-methionine (R)-S-oxide reductase n=1 Tax=Hyperionvirus sp. TaxID=2487770 RepID=A0A3G5AA72_9VIRU|nr:MAG: peptide-methionine (R)-S-oxide reductase [Hyperionvirus sp.]